MAAPRSRALATSASILLTLALSSTCKRRDTGDDIVVTSSTCIKCDSPRRNGALTADEMQETSGLVASSRSDGVFFAQNDSGDSARFFAIDAAGKLLATFVFARTPVVDCEDMARGPCDPAAPSTSCLFVGDIGDNDARRAQITVYRMLEPETLVDAVVTSEALTFVYPDGPHDAEALLVHPISGVLTIVTKVPRGASGIYEAPMPLTAGKVATLKKVGTITAPAGSPRFTSGSVHPAAKGILLRTYTHVFFAPMAADATVAASLAAPLCSLPVAREEQGESVTWTRAGDGFVTTSEGAHAVVSSVRCEVP